MDYPLEAASKTYSLLLMVRDTATHEPVRLLFKNDAVKILSTIINVDAENQKMFIKRLFEIKEPYLITFASKLVSNIKVAVESD